ncbi:unnamed protein product, partial [Adineta steineri]
MHLKAGVKWVYEAIRNYNVFLNEDDDENGESNDRAKVIKHQRYATRLYLTLFIVSFYVLIITTITNPQSIAVTVSNITPELFEQLRSDYGLALSCPCSTISIPYKAFISNEVSFDPVCTSIFTSRQWIEALYLPNASAYLLIDFRSTANSQFEILAALCSFSDDTISQSINEFGTNQFITVQLLPEDQVQAQVNAAIELIRENLHIQVTSIIQFLQVTTQQNGLITALNTVYNILMFATSYGYEASGQDLQMYGGSETCATDSSTLPAGFYPISYLYYWDDNYYSYLYYLTIPGYLFYVLTASANVSGFFVGCYPLNTLLESTLDCLYSDSCLEVFPNYFPALNQSTVVDYRNLIDLVQIVTEVDQFYTLSSSAQIVVGPLINEMNGQQSVQDESRVIAVWPEFLSMNSIKCSTSVMASVPPLTYDQASSHFPPNTTLSMIFEDLMVHQWNFVHSYELYWEACAPTSCSYTVTAHKNNFAGILLIMISMIGGLSAALTIITPLLINFFHGLFTRKPKRQQQQQQQVRPKLFDRIKGILPKIRTLIYTKLIDLNMFSLWTFGSDTNRMIAKRLGQMATRLYILLLMISFTIVALYTIIQPQLITKTFSNPSFNLYNNLVQKHGTTLQCQCSSISSTYNHYVEITPIFHQVCSSTFASNEWRENLLAGLVPDLSIYNTTDYRRFLLAHLHFLNGLCQISIQTVNSSINEFLSSTLSNTQLMSATLFRLQINSLIEQSQLDAPTAFNRILFLLRTINHGNTIVSTYGTNFEYTALLGPYLNFALVQAVIYDNNCSCGLNATCTTQANFISNNASEIIPVKGLKMGCTPSESFLASTLECFHDSSCINLIEEQTNYNNSINTTNTTIPLSSNNSHFLINTTVRDLVNVLFVEDWSTQINYSSYFEQCSPSIIYGGLTIALKWTCPWAVRLVANMNQYRKKKSNTVQPINTIDTISCHENVQRSSMNETNFPHMIVTTTSGKSTPSSVTTLPTSTVSTCQLMFNEPTSLSITNSSDFKFSAAIVNDFNGDGLLDLVTTYTDFYTVDTNLYVFLGNGDGNFREKITCPTGVNNYDVPGFLATADFN